MFELVIGVVAAALVGRLMRRKQQQRSTAIAAGEPAGVPCRLKWSAQGSRWRAGRLLISPGPLVWKPSLGSQEIVLPADLRQAGLRSPSLREAVSVNPGSRIMECDSSGGKVLIAVMPVELDHVIKALGSA
ncbi:hypothetical protein [Streptomyces sp. NBC_00102]|uniref:hypothetical protein n=1 Tax=Streptomyces sp. NBC_00102 TaxID=2975652 RepID=UPI00225793B6|nr:hypothetical protein [Streptomyces sp. NBC_00102]MCX5396125.1 hypothetical protein [Streptomyces sp. NBC_00102]